MDNIITEVKVLAVNADNQQKCKIDADIPAFESSYDIRFITWWSDQGEPPKVGQVGTAELKATSRQKYFIKKGFAVNLFIFIHYNFYLFLTYPAFK